MPLIWQDNDLFLEHEGPHGVVQVYHIYKDDLADCGARTFWYGLTPYGSDEGAGEQGEFDVRDLHAAEAEEFGFIGDEEQIRATVIRAIESGELRWPLEEERDEGGTTGGAPQ